MNTLKITKNEAYGNKIVDKHFPIKAKVNYKTGLLLGLLLLLWPVLQHWVRQSDPAAGYIDQNIWLLVLLSLICFLLVSGLCWWLLRQFWMTLGLPELGNLVIQFKKMESWQQLGFYWVSFGLLLLAAVGVLIAVL